MRKIALSLTFILSLSIVAFSQKAKVRGKVFDDSNGLSMIGANVLVQGTTNGTVTDLDGNFELSLDPGTYTLQISFITYQSILIQNINLAEGETKNLPTVFLKAQTEELKEFVVEATAKRTTETALLKMKSKSAAMIDGVSSATFKLAGDGSAAEAVKRVTGVSVEGGKYIYVRGLGDRYTKTSLNGMDIPGLDPDRNALQMDIFPTSLIDNIIISKNFTADMPADFTGGLVNIETKAFPDEKSSELSVGIGFIPGMHFTNDYVTSERGSLDWLGIDDGLRGLPDKARSSRVPTPVSGASSEEVNDFLQSFNPNLGTSTKTSFMDYSLSFSTGNQINLKRKEENEDKSAYKLGYTFSMSYKNETRYYDDVVYGEYQKWIDPSLTEMRYATVQNGQVGENNILIGTMGGLALKDKFNKYTLNAIHLQNGENRAGRFLIDNDGAAVGQSGYIAFSDNIEYSQRSLTNVILAGEHRTIKDVWLINWKVSGTYSTLSDPDIRKTAFTARPIDTIFIAGAGGNPSRIWRSLQERNLNARLDFERKYQFLSRPAVFKYGANQLFKSRDYEILFFDVQFLGNQKWSATDPNLVMSPENLYPNFPNAVYLQSGNNTPNPNQYSSVVSNSAAYLSTEVSLTARLKSILGMRVENFIQRHTGRDQSFANGDEINGNNLVNDQVLNSLDFFPSVNFIWSLTESQNLRSAYSKTIARPSFKELSFAQIIDPLTNRIFNGSLFTYPAWEGNLIETRIDNVDLRWEYISNSGETFSVSAFYKYFRDPIELVRIPEQQTSTEYQPRNVGTGEVYGIEAEFRKNLSFISESFKNFVISGNYTMVHSQIDMTEIEFLSRKTYEKPGENIVRSRQMAGQAPYVVNAGITYRNIEKGLNAGIVYNVKGPTLFIVGAGLFPDIYVDPFHSLNFSVSKSFGKDMRNEVDFKVSNILNDNIDQYYGAFQAENQPFTQFSPGTAFSLGYSFKF